MGFDHGFDRELRFKTALLVLACTRMSAIDVVVHEHGECKPSVRPHTRGLIGQESRLKEETIDLLNNCSSALDVTKESG